jgi:Xaa-Pro dipeptidase
MGLGLVTVLLSPRSNLNQYSVRIEKLREAIAAVGLKGVFLAPGPNLRYYTGGNSLLLERPFFMAIPLEGDPHLVAPTLEAGPYMRGPLKIAIHSWNDAEGPSNAIRETAAALNLTDRWGLEGSMPYRFIDQLLKFSKPELSNADSTLQGIRAVKDTQEVRLLSRAASILSKSFLKIPTMLKVGISELELSQQIAHEIHSNGAESVPDVLVQSGPMAADGHHLSSLRKLRRKESVVIDATCTYGGYFADITRTFILGNDQRFEKLYGNLLEAQISAVKAARTGAIVGSVDDAARASLRANNLDGYFTHRTGHGLGLEVHEAPYIVPDGAEVLESSMAFTVEPGVYMQGRTGLRIEDDLLTRTGSSVLLTKSLPKEYGWWN